MINNLGPSYVFAKLIGHPISHWPVVWPTPIAPRTDWCHVQPRSRSRLESAMSSPMTGVLILPSRKRRAVAGTLPAPPAKQTKTSSSSRARALRRANADAAAPRAAAPLTRGTKVWLRRLREMAALNGEACVVERDGGATVRVRRVCSGGEVLDVARRNLTHVSPHGLGAVLAVLAARLGVEVAERILAFVPCRRCWQACDARGTCRVRHPARERRVLAHYDAGDDNYLACHCGACQVKYQDFVERDGVRGAAEARLPVETEKFEEEGLRSESRRMREFHERDFDPGSMYDEFEFKYCYEGEHTTCEPRESDLRRAVPPEVELFAHCNPNLQAELDMLPEYVTSLRVLQHPGGPQVPFAMSCAVPRLERALPNLHTFETDVEDFRVVGAEGSDNYVPKLRSLTIHNRNLPSVRSVLQAAKTALEVVNLHNQKLTKKMLFAANALRVITLVNVSFEEFTLWAPNLEKLSAEQCPALTKIALLGEFKKNRATLPIDYVPPRLAIDLKLEEGQNLAVLLGGRENVDVTRLIQDAGGRWKETTAAPVATGADESGLEREWYES